MLEYLDGQLTPDLKQKLEEHFSGCSPCEEFLASYKATPSVCRKALANKIPDSVAQRLTDFLRAELKKP